MNLGRANQVQFLRFIAFFLLFEYHASLWVPDHSNIDAGGNLALFFFMLLSGAMASYSLYVKDIEPSKSNIFSYVKDKFLKFYPLYIVTNLIAVIYTVPSDIIVNHNYGELMEKGIEFIATVFMCQVWILKPYVYNSASWYVATIFWLSILNIPFSDISKRIIRKEKAIGKFSIIAVAGAMYSVLASMFFVGVVHINAVNELMAHPLVIGGFYVTGMALGNIVIILKETYPAFSRKTHLFTVLEFIVLAVSLGVIHYTGNANVYIMIFLLDMAIVVLFMLGYGSVSKIFSKRFFVELGNISFEAYMLHQVIIYLFISQNGWGTGSTLGNIYALSFCLLTSLVCAAILYNIKQSYKRPVEQKHSGEAVRINTSGNLETAVL